MLDVSHAEYLIDYADPAYQSNLDSGAVADESDSTFALFSSAEHTNLYVKLDSAAFAAGATSITITVRYRVVAKGSEPPEMKLSLFATNQYSHVDSNFSLSGTTLLTQVTYNDYLPLASPLGEWAEYTVVITDAWLAEHGYNDYHPDNWIAYDFASQDITLEQLLTDLRENHAFLRVYTQNGPYQVDFARIGTGVDGVAPPLPVMTGSWAREGRSFSQM